MGCVAYSTLPVGIPTAHAHTLLTFLLSRVHVSIASTHSSTLIHTNTDVLLTLEDPGRCHAKVKKDLKSGSHGLHPDSADSEVEHSAHELFGDVTGTSHAALLGKQGFTNLE